MKLETAQRAMWHHRHRWIFKIEASRRSNSVTVRATVKNSYIVHKILPQEYEADGDGLANALKEIGIKLDAVESANDDIRFLQI